MRKFEDIPEIIQEVFKLRVKQQGRLLDITDYLFPINNTNFKWSDTPEGWIFWDLVLSEENDNAFFDKYPLRSSLYPCTSNNKCLMAMDIRRTSNNKCIMAVDTRLIKRGSVLQNSIGLLPRCLCDYNSYMKQFDLLKDENSFNIDYSKSDWWKILEEGDEVITVDKKYWSRLELGTIIDVTEEEIVRIKEKRKIVHFDNNRYGVNFTYDMIRLHKKKNKQNNIKHESDLSTDSSTVQQRLGSTGFSLQGQTCQIATGSRLIGTRKSIGRSQAKTCSSVLTPLQHSIYS